MALLLLLFLFLAALTSAVAVDVREMSIDEYINFVNPPAVHKYQNKFGDSMLCVKFSDQISVKYAQDNITRGLEKPPKFNLDGENISKLGVKSECPEDTVVIREIKREDVERAGSVRQFLNRRGRRNHIKPNSDADYDGPHESATVQYNATYNPISRVSATFNVWRPDVAPDANFSLSHVWLSNRFGLREEIIEVGWTVYPGRYGDAEPRIFVYWTNYGYGNGCYDSDCVGFVVTDNPVGPGSRLMPVSTYEGEQHEIQVALEHQSRDDVGLIWAVLIKNEIIGYWPAVLFGNLGSGATHMDIGGEVAYSPTAPGTRLTKTDMGSGRFPGRGFGYATYTRAIHIYGYNASEFYPDRELYASKSACYNVTYNQDGNPTWGNHIFFGGPGGDSPQCVA